MAAGELLWRGKLVIDREEEEEIEKQSPGNIVIFTNISSLRKVYELSVNIGFLDKSKNNDTTFNWGQGMTIFPACEINSEMNILGTTDVLMKRFLKSALKWKDKEGKKINLNKYLKVDLHKT